MRFSKLNRDELKELLPFYLNGSLSKVENRQIEAWLSEDAKARQELEGWRQIQLAVSGQDAPRPPGRVYQSLMDRIQSSPERAATSGLYRVRRSELFGALILTLLVMFGLWKAVAPGIALEWSLQGEGVSVFRVYRARAGQAQFELISEIPAQAGTERYTFVDINLLPGKDYVYRVEGIGLAGVPAVSKSIISSSIGILPGQLAILLASLLVGLGTISLFSSLNHTQWKNLERPQFS